jgi:hypothetical protein
MTGPFRLKRFEELFRALEKAIFDFLEDLSLLLIVKVLYNVVVNIIQPSGSPGAASAPQPYASDRRIRPNPVTFRGLPSAAYLWCIRTIPYSLKCVCLL